MRANTTLHVMHQNMTVYIRYHFSTCCFSSDAGSGVAEMGYIKQSILLYFYYPSTVHFT